MSSRSLQRREGTRRERATARERHRLTSARGAAVTPDGVTTQENRPGPGKNLEQKSGVPVVDGAPEIAHPGEKEKWETQSAFVLAWLFEMWERVEARNKKASRAARAELQEFLLNSLGQSLRVALDDKDSIAKQWASKLLSDIFVSIGKHLRNDSTRVAQILNKSFVEN